MPLPEPLVVHIDGPNTIEKSHLAETLTDILLHLGYQVQTDPRHGFVTPSTMRVKPVHMPPIVLVEYEETLDDMVDDAEQQSGTT